MALAEDPVAVERPRLWALILLATALITAGGTIAAALIAKLNFDPAERRSAQRAEALALELDGLKAQSAKQGATIRELEGFRSRLAEAEQQIVELHQQLKAAREAARANVPGTPVTDSNAKGGSTTVPARSPGALSQPPIFETNSYRITVVSVKKSSEGVSVGLSVEGLGQKTARLNFCCQTYLVDDSGDQWDMYAPDSGGLFGAGVSGVELPPHTRRRTTVQFRPKGDASGKSFTFFTSDWFTNLPIRIHDLHL